MKKFLCVLIGLLLLTPLWATSYFVAQSGAGTGSGTGSSANAKSVANYNAGQTFGGATPAGGDTIFLTGTITTTLVCPSGGTSSSSLLTLDFSGATLSTTGPYCFNVNQKSFLTFEGGGRFIGGVFTGPYCDWGGSTGTALMYQGSNGGTASNYITVRGFFRVGGTGSTDSIAINYFPSQPYTFTTIDNNYIDNGQLWYNDKNTTHDLTFSNNYCRTNPNYTFDQLDIIQVGDGKNITITGNKLIMRTPGDNPSGQHNDCIQAARSNGGVGPTSSAPTGWIISYNWCELNCAPRTTGDNSWMILEFFDDQGQPACQVFGNVLIGDEGNSSNGIAASGNVSTGSIYYYNNTVALHSGPNNGVRFLSPGILYSRNNAMQATSGYAGTAVNWTFSVGATWDYNFFFRCNSPSSTYTGPHGVTNTDQKFTDFTNNDLSTQATSNLRNAGDSTIGATYNQGIAFGATWPNPALVTRTVGNWDVGAYQFVSGGSTSSSAMSGKATLMGGATIK